MSEVEFFMVLPLLLYGLAIADLVNSWRNFFERERYFPRIVTGVLLLEVAFWNFYKMLGWMSPDVFTSYYAYFRMLVPPLIFLLIVAVFTPDSGVTDVKAHFLKNMPIIFGGLALFVASHFLFETDKNFETRLALIAMLVATAIIRKGWVVYVLAVARALSMIIAA